MMKRILLIAAVLITTNAHAQFGGTLGGLGSFFGLTHGSDTSVIHYDSSVGMPYVNITPVHWVHNLPLCDRLYAQVVWPIDGDTTMAVIKWRVGYVPDGQATADPYGSGPAYRLTGAECAELRRSSDLWVFEWLCGGGTERLKLEMK